MDNDDSKVKKISELFDEAIQHYEKFIFSRKLIEDQGRETLICLYLATSVEILQSSSLLYRYKRRGGSTALLRSFLETTVNLVNLFSNEEYHHSVIADYHDFKIKLLTPIDGKNPYLPLPDELPNLLTVINEHKSELNKIKSSHKHYKDWATKFQLAKMNNEYLSVYRKYSIGAHSNPIALEERHRSTTKESAQSIVVYGFDKKRQSLEVISFIQWMELIVKAQLKFEGEDENHDVLDHFEEKASKIDSIMNALSN